MEKEAAHRIDMARILDGENMEKQMEDESIDLTTIFIDGFEYDEFEYDEDFSTRKRKYHYWRTKADPTLYSSIELSDVDVHKNHMDLLKDGRLKLLAVKEVDKLAETISPNYWKCDCSNNNVHLNHEALKCNNCMTEYNGQAQNAPISDVISHYVVQLNEARNTMQVDTWVRGTNSGEQFIGIIEKIVTQRGKPTVFEIAVKFTESKHLAVGSLVYHTKDEVTIHRPPMGYEMAQRNIEEASTYSWSRKGTDLTNARNLLKDAAAHLEEPFEEAVNSPENWLEIVTK